MPQNDGRRFEQLVTWIESHYVPRGFKVDTRVPVLDDEGKLVAEFDILVTGRIGTAPCELLIECRDRPSDGPAPASWIEQLIGRRTRFRLSKVMAVSTTGFTPGAVAAARDARIELRELQGLSYEDVCAWLPMNVPLVMRDAWFHAVRVEINGDGAQSEERSVSTDDPILHVRESSDCISLKKLWGQVTDDRSVWTGVITGGPAVEKSIDVGDESLSRLSVFHDGREWPIRRIQYDATLREYVPVMPLRTASAYSRSDGTAGEPALALTGTWTGGEKGPVRELTVILFRDPPSK